MLSSISSFFQKHLSPRADESPADAVHKTHLAAAALLVEVIQSDAHVSAQERQSLLDSIARQFDLTSDEAHRLLALAQEESKHATDLHQFTSLINREFAPDRKIALIEDLWRAAYADEVLHKHEEHLIRKVADLLYVSHTAFIAAKHRVRRSGD